MGPQTYLDHTVQVCHYPPPPPSADKFKVIYYVAHTVSKRTVGVQLKCLLVFVANTSVFKIRKNSDDFCNEIRPIQI